MTMTANKTATEIPACENAHKPSDLNISKIGIVSRDYKETESFRKSLPAVLELLDGKGCDAVLFSLFSLKAGYDPREAFEGLENIKAVFVEAFTKRRNPETGKPKREGKGFFVYYRTSSGWEKYQLNQKFATLTHMSHKKRREFMGGFVKDEMPTRCLGNCCILLCGESNGVNYKTDDKKIYDDFKLRKAIPEEVMIILNPCHDRMTRFQIPMKREFLSKKGRWVISVWCKGKTGGKTNKSLDVKGPAWMIYHNGEKQDVGEIKHDCGAAVYIGILDVQ